MSAEGQNNRVIAQNVPLSRQSVVKWRNRFLQQGLMGLYDERRSGRPRSVDAEKITALIPQDAHHKTSRWQHSLDVSVHRCRNEDIQIRGSAYLVGIGHRATPAEALQAIDRSLLH